MTLHRLAAAAIAAGAVALTAAAPASAADDSTIFGTWNTIAIDSVTRVDARNLDVVVTYSCEDKDDLRLTGIFDSTTVQSDGYPARGSGVIQHADLTCDDQKHTVLLPLEAYSWSHDITLHDTVKVSVWVENPEGAPYAKRTVTRTL